MARAGGIVLVGCVRRGLWVLLGGSALWHGPGQQSSWRRRVGVSCQQPTLLAAGEWTGKPSAVGLGRAGPAPHSLCYDISTGLNTAMQFKVTLHPIPLPWAQTKALPTCPEARNHQQPSVGSDTKTRPKLCHLVPCHRPVALPGRAGCPGMFSANQVRQLLRSLSTHSPGVRSWEGCV